MKPARLQALHLCRRLEHRALARALDQPAPKLTSRLERAFWVAARPAIRQGKGSAA